ncbi:MAG: histone deacetylase [Candidatus Omnitrophica bacterium]|nr:histone deacetylase [Candidatus Omnitrophota bacterium]
MRTAIVYDQRYLLHDPGSFHPENQERLARTWKHLESQNWFSQLEKVAPNPADISWIAEIHSSDYVNRAEKAIQRGDPYLDCLDVGISEKSYEVALLAVGGALKIADQVMSGAVKNAFGLLRPPGHHAERDLAMGFCIFNNIAVVAQYLRRKHGVQKILILDWDVHHGNGTQHIFEADPDVFYISLHQHPFYPGTGAAHETGTGKGKGATLNCPMPAGAGDKEYETVFCEKILPKANEFKPDVVLISAGFDAHKDDPLAQICLTTEFFGWMTARVMEIAEKHAGGKIISLLEGGYHLQQLPLSVAKHLRVLAGLDKE